MHVGSSAARVAAAAATAAAPDRAGLPLPPSAEDCKSLGLVQVAMVPGRTHSDEEEEPINAEHGEQQAKEENVVEEMEKGDFSQAIQRVPKSARLGMAALELNHTAGNHSNSGTGRGLQPVSRSQVSSRTSVSDAGSAAAPAPFSSDRSRLKLWTGLRQLGASLHSRVVL